METRFAVLNEDEISIRHFGSEKEANDYAEYLAKHHGSRFLVRPVK